MLQFQLVEGDYTRTVIISQDKLFRRGLQLGDDEDWCHLAVRPTNEALGKGQNTIMIGTTFLENYYIFLLANDIVNTVGITEANPINVILDAHYNS